MPQINRKLLLRTGTVVMGLLLFLVAAVWIVLQSDWFRDQVRRRIIAQTEQATGGKVDIGSFDYDARKLTATLHDFVVHGTEPPGAEPLLKVDTTVVTIRIISLLERSADISSVVFTHPRVNLMIQPDGSTNIPSPKLPANRKDPIEELFALKLNHLQIDNGLISASDARIPLNLRSDNVSLLLNYRRPDRAYELAVSTPSLDLSSLNRNLGPLEMFAKVRFDQTRAVVQTLTLTGSDSTASVSGTLEHFAHPKANFKVEAGMPGGRLAALTGVNQLRGGRISLEGAGEFQSRSGLSFRGRVSAQQIGVYLNGLTLKSVSGSSDIDGTEGLISFKRISASTLGARFSGEASIKNRRDLRFDGEITNVLLKEVAGLMTPQPFAWSGEAHGPVHGSASLAGSARDFAFQADLLLAPVLGGIPVSGAVRLTYNQRAGLLQFGGSSLAMPHSSIAFSGTPQHDTRIVVDSSDIEELKPVMSLAGAKAAPEDWPLLLEDGAVHFEGVISNLLVSPNFNGRVAATDFRVFGESFDSADGNVEGGPNGLNVSSLTVRQGGAAVSVDGLLGLERWRIQPDSPIRGALALKGISIEKLAAHFPDLRLPPLKGIMSGSVRVRGTLSHPEGNAHISSDSLDAYGERLNQVQFDADLTGDRLQIANGRVVSSSAMLRFSGDYTHQHNSWQSGEGSIKADSNGFPLASLSPIRRGFPGLNALAEVHMAASARVNTSSIEPTRADGSLDLKNVTYQSASYGNLSLRATTQGESLQGTVSGDLRKNPFNGNFQVRLNDGDQTSADIDFERVAVGSLYPLISSSEPLFDGFAHCRLRVQGPLREPDKLRSVLTADKLELASRPNQSGLGSNKVPSVTLHNNGPLVVELFDRVATVRSFHVEGENTDLAVTGAVPLAGGKAMDVRVDGSVNMKVFHLFDPNVESAGISVMAATVGGTLADPTVNGTLTIKDGSFFLENVPNGLSGVNGTVTFNRNRATLQKMTAHSGGGDLSLGGFVSFGGGGPLIYHLEGSADNVRVRYAGSISVTASSKLRLSGSSSASLLSGTVTISRVVFNTNTDVGNIVAGLGSGGGGQSDNGFLSDLNLDVAIENSPNMDLSTALSRDVEAEIDLRLRGTPDHPILLGSLSANKGDIQAFGSRYTINRGEISFVNSVKIEPVLDLDLETRARGVTVDITIAGTLNKLNISYRSDPPLQPREIIALLAVGRAPDSAGQNLNVPNRDAGSLQAGANSLLGAAVTSPLSNRLSKLFGITNVRIEPLVQGSTLTPQARVSLEQQISRDITITYVTNLSQTSEQIFRFEWAFSRQYSVVALRDDNGEFGIDFQYKKQFK